MVTIRRYGHDRAFAKNALTWSRMSSRCAARRWRGGHRHAVGARAQLSTRHVGGRAGGGVEASLPVTSALLHDSLMQALQYLRDEQGGNGVSSPYITVQMKLTPQEANTLTNEQRRALGAATENWMRFVLDFAAMGAEPSQG